MGSTSVPIAAPPKTSLLQIGGISRWKLLRRALGTDDRESPAANDYPETDEMLRVGSILTAVFLFVPRSGWSQCSDPHYRWTEKTDESLANTTAVKAYVTTILKSWAALEFTSQAKYKCSDRKGRELKVYTVTGWVRRVRTGESDGDWHIELTSRQNSPVDSCIVMEIPPANLNGNYSQARQDLQTRVTWASNSGDVLPPIKLRFIGAAFFDGEHRGGVGRRDKTDGAHGRCNSSARALWELHPVYWVLEP